MTVPSSVATGRRVLVTGAGGFIGAALARRLAADGDQVIAIVRPGTHPERLRGASQLIELVRADLTDLPSLRRTVDTAAPTLVVHCAASPGNPLTSAARLAAWRDTVLATATLLEALRCAPVKRLVHFGSALEFAPQDGPIPSNAPLAPTSARGATKAAATIAVRQWAVETGGAMTVLRPFSVYGPEEPPNRFIPTLLRCLRSGDPLPLAARPARRDFVHLDDVIDACVRALRSSVFTGELNLGSGIERTTAEVVTLAEEITGRTVRRLVGTHPGTPADRAHWLADITEARRTLAWVPTRSLSEGLAELWRSGE